MSTGASFHTTLLGSHDVDAKIEELNNDENREEFHASLPAQAVEICIFDLEWFYADRRNFIYFSRVMQDVPNSVLSSEFVTSMIDMEVNWAATRRYIAIRYFAVYLAYLVCSVVYMRMALD